MYYMSILSINQQCPCPSSEPITCVHSAVQLLAKNMIHNISMDITQTCRQVTVIQVCQEWRSRPIVLRISHTHTYHNDSDNAAETALCNKNFQGRVYTVSQKKEHFCFCYNFVKFPLILINFGRKMAKWLKLYATYTFSTSPNLCHRTTWLNTDAQNCYITPEFITIILRVRHPSVERPPYSDKGTAALCLKKINAQELTLTKKQAKMTPARQLLNRYPNLTVNFMFFYWRKAIHRCCPDQLTERSFSRPFRYQNEECQRKTDSFERDRHSASQSVDAQPMDAGLAV